MVHDVAIPIQHTFSHRPRPYAHGRGTLQWGYRITVDQTEAVFCNILASHIFVEGLKVTSCCKCPLRVTMVTLRFCSPVLKCGLWISRHPETLHSWRCTDGEGPQILGCFRESFWKKILHYLVRLFVNSLDISDDLSERIKSLMFGNPTEPKTLKSYSWLMTHINLRMYSLASIKSWSARRSSKHTMGL